MLIKKGNLLKKSLEGKFDVIIYFGNCFNSPISLLGKEIRELFPLSKYIDNRTKKGDKRKMGGYSKCEVNLREIDYKINKKLVVINAYLYYSNKDPQFEYKYLKFFFKLIKKNYTGKKIAFPLIGNGLKNISITKICEIIDNELNGEEYYLVLDSD